MGRATLGHDEWSRSALQPRHVHANARSNPHSNQNTSPHIGPQNGREGLPSQSDHDLGNDSEFRLTSQNRMIGLSCRGNTSTQGDETMRLLSEDVGNRIFAKDNGQCEQCEEIGPTTLFRMLGHNGEVIGSYELCKSCDEGASE